jgi:hypothetical protein
MIRSLEKILKIKNIKNLSRLNNFKIESKN